MMTKKEIDEFMEGRCPFHPWQDYFNYLLEIRTIEHLVMYHHWPEGKRYLETVGAKDRAVRERNFYGSAHLR